MKKVVYCCLICLLCSSAICNKRLDCKQTIYSFAANYKVYPDKDSIRINDTVWVELVTPVKMMDLVSNQMIDYSGAENFGPSITYIELTGGDRLNTGSIAAANDFENHIIWGTPVPFDKPDQVRGFKCIEENGLYKFKVGIVPKKKGLFFIGFHNSGGVYRKHNKCDKAAFGLTIKDTDQHLYLLEQSRPGYVLSGLERSNAYCFVVY
jgi:hypothetical protein